MIRAIIWGLGKEFNRYYNLLKYHEMINNLQVIGITANSAEYSVCCDYSFIYPNSIDVNKIDVVIVTIQKTTRV